MEVFHEVDGHLVVVLGVGRGLLFVSKTSQGPSLSGSGRSPGLTVVPISGGPAPYLGLVVRFGGGIIIKGVGVPRGLESGLFLGVVGGV